MGRDERRLYWRRWGRDGRLARQGDAEAARDVVAILRGAERLGLLRTRPPAGDLFGLVGGDGGEG
jgi:hypothetical protein